MAETTAELIAQGHDITTTLSDTEKSLLEQREEVIAKGLNTFLEVGGALADIRDHRLYRETHKTFELYCKETWDLSKSKAYYQISGYETVALLENKMSTIVDGTDADKSKSKPVVLPFNESQTRPLTKLKDPDDQVKAWGIVLRQLNEKPDTKLTAALISKAVKEVQGGVIQRKIQKTREEVDKTSFLTRQFQNQYQVLLDIVVAAKNGGWKECKQKAVVKHLENLAEIAKSDD